MRQFIGKALIPVAGLGTRLRPLSAVVPKAMMPVPDEAGRVLPVLHHVLAEARAAGVEEAAVVVSPNQEEMLAAYLRAAKEKGVRNLFPCARRTPPAISLSSGRSHRMATVGKKVPDPFFLPQRVKLIVQTKPLGFGHAVWLGKRFVGREPFLVFLGDHIQVSRPGKPACAAQVAGAFARCGGAATIGMQQVGPEELRRVGVARGEPVTEGRSICHRTGKAAEGKRLYRCTDFVEKPSLAAARKRLRTPGLPKDTFLAHCGIYAFAPEILDCLEELMSRPPARGGEYQLADAQSILLRRHPRDYYLVRIAGRAYDTGTPAGYLAAWKALL